MYDRLDPSTTSLYGPRTARSRSSGALATSKSQVSLQRGKPPSDHNLTAVHRNGASQHGDYVFGWKGDSLQRALDKRCTGDVCSVLKTQSADEAIRCTKPPIYKEEINGELYHMSELPSFKKYVLIVSQGNLAFRAWSWLLSSCFVYFAFGYLKRV